MSNSLNIQEITSLTADSTIYIQENKTIKTENIKSYISTQKGQRIVFSISVNILISIGAIINGVVNKKIKK